MSNTKQVEGFPVQLEDVDKAIKEASPRVCPVDSGVNTRMQGLGVSDWCPACLAGHCGWLACCTVLRLRLCCRFVTCCLPESSLHCMRFQTVALTRSCCLQGSGLQAATVLRSDPSGRDALVAYLSSQPRLSADELARLDGKLRGRLPFHLVPALLQPSERPLPEQAHGEVCTHVQVLVYITIACFLDMQSHIASPSTHTVKGWFKGSVHSYRSVKQGPSELVA